MRALYTIDTETAQVRYAGNGVTTAFSVTFQFFEASTLRVRTVVGETTTRLTFGLDYSVTGGNGETGAVTISPALSTGTSLLIDLDMPILQETIDLAPNGPLPAEDVEQGFDRIVTMVKQLRQDLTDVSDRALLAPVSDLASPGPLPTVTGRANSILGFDGTGAPYAAILTSGVTAASSWVVDNFLPATSGAAGAQALASPYAPETLAAAKALTARPAVLLIRTGSAKGLWEWQAGSSATADDALVFNPTSGPSGRYTRLIFDGIYRLSWWGPDNTGATDCAQKVRDWFTAFTASGVNGHAEAGRYRCDTAMFFDLGRVQQGTRMTGASMYGTIFDVRTVATSPQWLFYASGGSPSAPAEANYWHFADFAISGNIGSSNISVQWGTDNFADAINSATIQNVWMANSNTAKSATAVGVRYNNTVRCVFNNIVNAAGTEQLDKTISGAANNGSGKVRLTLNNTTGLLANMVVPVAGVVGTTEANGTRTILTVVDGTRVDVDATYVNAYGSGGTLTAYKGWGIAQQVRQSAFCSFSGAFGPAGTGVHITGGAPYGNVWLNPTIEMVDDAIKQDVATGPNMFITGQYAVYGGGYLVSNTGSGSSGFLVIDNPNNGSPATNLYASTGKGVDPSGYYMIDIRGYYGDGPQLVTVGASPFTWTNKTGQKQVPIISGGTVSKIEYKGPNSGSVFADTYATHGTMPPVASGASIKITHTGAPTFFVSPAP